jgi:hypothetical protein
MRLEQARAKTSKTLLRVICDQELIGIGTTFMRNSDRFPAPDEAGACATKTLPASDRELGGISVRRAVPTLHGVDGNAIGNAQPATD